MAGEPKIARTVAEARMSGLRWVQDRHRADTIDLRDTAGRLRGWVAPVLGIWRGVVPEPGFRPSPFSDHQTEAAARAWVEGEVCRVSIVPTLTGGQTL